MKVLVILGDGFEETEAIAPIDIMRRAGLEVHTAYTENNPVTGSHQIAVMADISLEEVEPESYSMIYLPGGPATEKLREDHRVISLVKEFHKNNGYIAALCAAPTILAKAGIADGKRVTCFPGCEPLMGDAVVTGEPYVIDGEIITGKGAGVSISFGLQLVKALKGEEKMTEVKSAMQVYWQE